MLELPALLKDETIQGIDLEYFHTLAFTTLGRIFAFGQNISGQLGLGHTNPTHSPSVAQLTLSEGERIRAIQAGNLHTLVLTTHGRIFAFGNNSCGQLGLGHTNVINRPTLAQIPGLLQDETIRNISTGYYHTLVLTTHNHIFSFGDNEHGQLGLGYTGEKVYTPSLVQLPLLEGETIRSLSAGSYYTIVLSSQDRIFAFGQNNRGQLGLGHANPVDRPTQVQLPLEEDEAIQNVAAGYSHTIVLTTHDRVFTFGLNEHGERGWGTQTNQESDLSYRESREPRALDLTYNFLTNTISFVYPPATEESSPQTHDQ